MAHNGIKDALNAFNITIQNSLTQPEPKQSDADEMNKVVSKASVDMITHMQDEKNHLSVDRVITLIDLFETNGPSAIMYMALVHTDVQQAWLEKKLVELGFPVKDNSWVEV